MNDELVLTSPGEESIGPRLAKYREARGLTLAAAAARLHCDESLLRALETERFAEVGARVFVQGHLRRYADLVGAPVDELLAEWSRRGAAGLLPDLTQVPRAPTRAVDPQIWARRIGSAAAALVIGVAAWWILRGGNVGTPATGPVPSPSVTAATPGTAAPLAAATTMPAATTPVATGAAAAPSAATLAAVPPAATLPAAQPPRPPATAGQRSLLLTAGSADTWVEIYDADGRKLFFDLVRSGSRAMAQGAPPLRVLVGRADTTAMRLDGREVAIPGSLMRNGTAHFTVDAQSRLTRYVRPVPLEASPSP